jgi:hypothetical protein
MMKDMSQPEGRPPRVPLKTSRELLRTLTSQDLVDCLQSLFPDRLPHVVVDPSTLGRLIGHQEVIRCIRQSLEEQSKHSVFNTP